MQTDSLHSSLNKLGKGRHILYVRVRVLIRVGGWGSEYGCVGVHNFVQIISLKMDKSTHRFSANWYSI